MAIIAAALLVVLNQLGGAGGSSPSGQGGGKLYSGIPQHGTTLGKSGAPVTIYLYEDFQCPYCGQSSRETFPKLVDRYVREGEVKMVSETLAFLGPDSVQAAKGALAAREQNHYWPYYSLLFEEQGQENSGYVSRDYLEDLAKRTPGLDVNEWKAQLTKDSFDSELESAASRAESAGVNSTPTLILKGPGGQKKLVGLQDYDQIAQAIDQVNGS